MPSTTTRPRALAGLLRALAILACILLPAAAPAQSFFERLVMPGDLAQAHAKLQAECDNCHRSFSKTDQADLCLDCHKEIAADVTGERGFHGRSPLVAGQECSHCHTDHKGRDADIVAFDPETFGHDITDFPLRGGHATAPCAGCHVAGKPLRDAPGQCIDCHRDDDRHAGALGTECADCHVVATWTDVAKFDHSKTRFALTDAHAKVACAACHAGEVYRDLPRDCIGCHRIQDVHRDSFGTACDKCHGPTRWTEVRFDHGRDTDFTLVGKHATADCAGCHLPGHDAFAEQTPTDCAACHARDDVHEGALGTACATCHDPASWTGKVRFDHDITRFPLIGLHVLVPCEECHLDRTFQMPAIGCATCHAEDDSHDGRLGSDCGTCHNPNGWDLWLFDHDRQTRFPLEGKHAGVQCRACHETPGARMALPTACVACHAGDDVHKGQFGTACENCHVPSDWKKAKLKLVP